VGRGYDSLAEFIEFADQVNLDGVVEPVRRVGYSVQRDRRMLRASKARQ